MVTLAGYVLLSLVSLRLGRWLVERTGVGQRIERWVRAKLPTRRQRSWAWRIIWVVGAVVEFCGLLFALVHPWATPVVMAAFVCEGALAEMLEDDDDNDGGWLIRIRIPTKLPSWKIHGVPARRPAPA